MTEPRKALAEASANTVLISPVVGTIQAMNHKGKGNTLKVDLAFIAANPDDYDGLLVPDGVANSDELRTNAKAVSFVKRFFESGKPVAAICHGPWMLVEADVVRGRPLTSWPSLKTDIRNAAGIWVDREVVRDGQLITSRKPMTFPHSSERCSRDSRRRRKIRLIDELTHRCCANLA